MLNMLESVEIPKLNGAVGRVLLVEDDDVQREGMAQWLRGDGLVLDECSTVDQAVARYQGQVFDVVVTDLRLHGGSGLDLIRQLREMDPFASAVVVTQFADMAAATAALRGGAVDFVAKPLMPDCWRRWNIDQMVSFRSASTTTAQEELYAQPSHFAPHGQGRRDAYRLLTKPIEPSAT